MGGLPQVDAAVAPSARPLAACSEREVRAALQLALGRGDGVLGAHCVHELWMRGEIGLNVEAALERLWKHAADSIPDWLPMRHVEWLPSVYEITAHWRAGQRGHHNIYLVLLDYSDSRAQPYGIYVGMSHYSGAQRFDQHKAGIRAAGSVLRRGLEVLAGPTRHLQHIERAEALRIEEGLAQALAASGLFVQGGH